MLRAMRPLAAGVADALTAQNARLAPSAARDAHLASLRRGAAAVVTGQQVGLFLGPLFTIYKAASAVCVARALAAESGQCVVPVFWLQTEDHDLLEIAACHVPRAHGVPLTLQLPASPVDRISIAHRVLPEAVTTCLQQLRAEFTNLPYAEAHLAQLARHYRPGTGWADAFAGVVAELFAAEGLVLIDPRDPALAHATKWVHHRAVNGAQEISDALEDRAQALAAAGFEALVHVRPGAPLSFFHPDGATGARYRLAPTRGGFTEVGGERTHTRDALLAALDAEPLQFSTSALLRPILQDSLLPTAAYVGGPAEVAYFAQLAPLYAAYGLSMPIVVPRARFRILEDKTTRLLARLHLEPDDAQRAEDELLATADDVNSTRLDRAELTHTLLAPFDTALGAVRTHIEHLGPGLPVAIEKTHATVAMAISKLADKYEQARRHQNQALVDDVRRVKLLLYPNDAPQERFYGLPYFAARYGAHHVIARVLAAVAPFDPLPRDLLWSGHDAPSSAARAVEVPS